MSVVVLTAALCLVAGALLGLLGGGGSILAAPVLIYAAGLGPRTAIVTSLLVVGTSSALTAALHARAKRVDVPAGLSLGIASMTGAYAGGRLAHLVPASILMATFIAMMIVTSLFMMRPRSATPDGAAAPRLRRGWLLPIGLGLGLVTGMVGAGGGFVIVPALVLLLGLPMRRAVGTSSLVIAMNSFAGFAGVVGSVTLDWRVTLVATISASMGGVAGAWLSPRVGSAALRVAFAWFVLGVSGFMVAKQLPASMLGHVRAASSYLVGAASGCVLVAAVWLGLHLRRTSSHHQRTSPRTSR